MAGKYVFFDRDGVINQDRGELTHGYITRWEDFLFVPGVLEQIKRLTENGYRIIVVSNQQGVAKGYYSMEDLKIITDNMITEIRKAGGDIFDVYYCTHLKEDNCDCRKPKPGSFLKAQKDHGMNSLRGCFFIGDTESDMQVGQRMGMIDVFIATGKYTREDAQKWFYKPDYFVENLKEAVDLILSTEAGEKN